MINRSTAFISKNLRQANLTQSSLAMKTQYNQMGFSSDNPYNKRWEYKWKHSYYTYPRDYEHTEVRKPQDSKDVPPIYFAYYKDFVDRWLPGMNMWWQRRHRIFDKFNVYFLPGMSLFFYQFADLALGFKIMAAFPLFLAYTRIRDKTLDPDFKETYLRDMIYQNPEITKYFNEETIHVLDYEFEYLPGYLCPEKFPEYQNKTWQFFNTDTAQAEGFFKFGDVESGATMTLKFKTMPIPGKFRYQVGEPFYFYDLRAEIKCDGVYKEVVLVDEKESLKKIRPFLFLI
ncbi:transmembrane protein, putative (macronuclear) [Tetrahymena thermophila SB210]|uniref:Transmembrane protein, putative n=1 Tax=Tetrahymena thermophila (strain SB210) TaxID=312017 RepID=I7M8Q3_TETTS|nr:transmembrane protein, putative [Tetrahymena thermophila SB210]6YNX_G Chain G, ATPTT3 [Tetrahymena thermophila]6YNX_g Chain g, ATPTT3 [Tetrahymena thermophila]6YNY_G Chain G, ATPTT3 [Tetrahymena thermophila]6YNY_g Chain g, ATPTT3 [Tetrahymena thermophila]6YNZ_G Chain G, ATPTT3 [Tetrahymena thermophila]6YNZ_G3 Chain G3, ATPTT3 [Tetrahymena thermophila]6YNZ_g Chain g, ATPTT3 [Tetrahymena thermophila]6YNZ_g3 Chain g3, ATPTT3 [Tetrahymena thermophila]EAR99458.2 transmembrane protein, putati|eukprot:XP_001019703.2 transmembrane protein, putative [Tetrahymena thermophila SB210]